MESFISAAVRASNFAFPEVICSLCLGERNSAIRMYDLSKAWQFCCVRCFNASSLSVSVCYL